MVVGFTDCDVVVFGSAEERGGNVDDNFCGVELDEALDEGGVDFNSSSSHLQQQLRVRRL